MDTFIEGLEKKLEVYENLVNKKMKEGLLTETTARTYILHSRNFVRWCRGEFIPGEKNNR